MSDKNETRIVSIKFDNKDFEKNVQQSLDTLSRLNKALEFQDGTKGLDNVSNAAKNVNMSSLSNSVSEVSNGFSKLEVIGITALANITNSAVNAGKNLVRSLIDPVVRGGWQRALNMEQAKFMFGGLGFTQEQIGAAGKVGTIMDNINKSVKGTIYSLDQGAVLASQLMASGIKGTGKDSELEHILRAVAGVSSVYNASYDRIGQIFGEVKAQTVLMGGQVESLRLLGIPIYKILADYLNEIKETNKYDEKTVKEMISDGEISFEMFSKALEEKFGDQAFKSKNTFTGAMAAMEAAAARLGEAFYKHTLPALRDFFNALVPVYEAISTRLEKPIASAGNTIADFLAKATQGIDLIAAALDYEGTLKRIKELNETVTDDGDKLASDERLANLTKYKDVIDKIASGLEIFKTIFTFLKTALETVWSIISNVFKVLSPAGQLILTIGDGLNVLVERLAAAVEKIKDFSDSTSEYIDNLIEAINNSELFSTIVEKIKSAFDGLSGFADSLGQSIENLSEHISKVVYNLTDGLFNALQRAKEGVGELTKGTNMLSTVLGVVLAMKFNRLTDIFGGAHDKANGMAIGKFLEDMGFALFNQIRRASANLADAMNELRITMQAYQNSIKADMILKIALAIGTFALALKLLSTIDAQALLQSVGALGVLAVILKKTLKSVFGILAMTELLSWKQLAGFALIQGALISIGLAMISMATAVKILGSMDLASATKGVIALFALSKILVMTLSSLSTIPKLNILTINLSFISIAIMILAAAMKLIASMSWEELGRGAVGLLAIQLILIQFIESFAQIEKAQKGVNPLSLLAVALAIDMLAVAFCALGKMEWGEFARAAASMTTIGLVLAGMMLAIGKINGEGNALKNAASLLIVSIALGMLAKSFIKLADLGWDQIGKAVVSMIAMFAFTAVLMDIISGIKTPEDLLTRMGSLIALAFSIQIIANAFVALGQLSWEGVAKAAIGMVSIGILVAAMTALSKKMGESGGIKDFLLLSVAMIAMGAAIQIFAIGMAALSLVPMDSMITSLFTFVGAIFALAYSAQALESMLPAMLKLAGTIAVLGLSLAVVGAAFMVLGLGLQTLVTGISSLTVEAAVGFVFIVAVLAALQPVLIAAGIGMGALGAGMIVVGLGIAVIGLGIAALALGFKTLSTSMKDVVTSINEFTNIDWTAVSNLALLVTIFGILSPLAAALGLALMTVGAGLDLIALGVVGIGKGFLLVEKAINGIFKIVDTKISSIVDKASAKLKLFKTTVKTFSSVVKTLFDALKTAIKNIDDLKSEAYKSGANVVDGLIRGINSNKSRAIAAANALAKETLQAYKDSMGIESPSKEMAKLGMYTVMGVSKGIADNTHIASDAMNKLAMSILSSYAYVDENIDTSPVIKPVLDLSNIETGADTMDGLLGSSFGVPINGVNNARMAAASITGFENMDARLNSTLHKLTGSLDNVTESMNSRSLNNYITVDGASDPSVFVDDLIRSFRLNARTV